MSNYSNFKNNHFRPTLFIISILLSIIMIIAAKWQWRRYHEKLSLVETYKTHSSDVNETHLTKELLSNENYKSILNKKVSLRGKFDFNNQILIGNRRSKYGAGFWLMTPFQLKDNYSSSENKINILISRGFIPYEDKNESNWSKYNLESQEIEISGVVSNTVDKRNFFSPSANFENSKILLYPNMEEASKLVPYSLNKDIYIQAILPPVLNNFPLTDIKIDVPPSTHFWYTFEWIILAILTQVICFLYQLFRPKKLLNAKE